MRTPTRPELEDMSSKLADWAVALTAISTNLRADPRNSGVLAAFSAAHAVSAHSAVERLTHCLNALEQALPTAEPTPVVVPTVPNDRS